MIQLKRVLDPRSEAFAVYVFPKVVWFDLRCFGALMSSGCQFETGTPRR